MRNIFFFIVFVSFFSLQAQFSIKGTIDPGHDYSWILLYKMQNGEQTYVANADVVDGAFSFEIDQNEPTGIYRAYYQIENSLYVEFIYNKEDVEFSFDPNDPEVSIYFSESQENTLYQNYYKSIKSNQQKVDSVQVLYFQSTQKEENVDLEKKYKQYLTELQTEQKRFEGRSSGMLANHYIKASSQYNAPMPHKDPNDYLSAIKDHFFDAMDLGDTVLSHSSFINDRLNDYVFYLNQADHLSAENELQKTAIDKAVIWIGNHTDLLASFEEDLLENYLLHENVEMINFVMDNYYNKLPQALQNDELKKQIYGTLKTAIGVRAPDFSWKNNDGTSNSLYSLSGTDYYILLFFSSNCPHCQIEIPEFYKFISGIENIKVVAVGLEDEKESWEAMIDGYKEFINILDLEKWSSQKVKNYGIKAIPTYYVLDADKNILAKPKDFEDLRSMFETR